MIGWPPSLLPRTEGSHQFLHQHLPERLLADFAVGVDVVENARIDEPYMKA
jgi:hypothetical protein